MSDAPVATVELHRMALQSKLELADRIFGGIDEELADIVVGGVTSGENCSASSQ